MNSDDNNNTFDSEKRKKNESEIKKFTKNLNQIYNQEKEDKLEIIGREKEIKEIIYTLSRLFKNNALLIGHPGVGKTALVEGLVQWIEKKKTPQYLWNKNIYQLDVIALMAGTKFQGELEERLKLILDYMAEPTNNAILFIDEIHALVGTGRSQGQLDISNLFKPKLVKGEIQCIGATTYEEYRQYIEKDGALTRRFSNIIVNEPNADETYRILQGICNYFEKYYKLKISDDALVAAIAFSLRYLNEKYQPDSSIDILDDACSRTKSKMWQEPEIIEQVQKNIQNLEIEKLDQQKNENLTIQSSLQQQIDKQKEALEKLIAQDQKEKLVIQKIIATQEKLYQAKQKFDYFQQTQNYAEASKLKYEIIFYLNETLEHLEKEAEKHILRKYFVKKEQIAELIAEKYNLPLKKILTDEQNKLLALFPAFQEKIKGQNQALKAITDCIFRARAEIQDPKKPVASFLFMGPTGVGKTETALIIADQLYDTREKALIFNMTEFSEPHSISKFLGSPAGYIGFEQKTYFESVREKMSNVIVFDEIEKCHSTIINLFLQILDTGLLKLSNGREINFRNSIIIFTSNLGSELYEEDWEQKKLEDELNKELKNHFQPWFINRLDEIVFFNTLNEKTFYEIIRKELKLFTERIEQEKQIKLIYTDRLISNIFKETYSSKDGARPIKHYIEKKIGTAVARNIIFQVIQIANNYVVDIEEETKQIQIKISTLPYLQTKKKLLT